MKGMGAFNLSLAEVALNMLAVTMLLLLIVKARVQQMVPAQELEKTKAELSNKNSKLKANDEKIEALGRQHAEDQREAQELKRQLDKALGNTSKITPTCGGGPVFQAKVAGNALYLIGGELLDLPAVVARYSTYTAQNARVTKGCVFGVVLQANRKLDGAVAFSAMRELSPHFRVSCIGDSDG